MNFKLLFQQTGKVILFYIMELRGFYFKLLFNQDKILSIKIQPNLRIKYLAKGDIALILYKNEVLVKHQKSFEFSTLNLFSTLLKKGDVVLDIGANSGLYSIFYSKFIGDTGRIFAFEPDQSTFRLLNRNVQINNCKNVSTYDYALSNRKAKIKMVSEPLLAVKVSEGDSFKYMEEMPPNKVDVINPVPDTYSYRMDDLDIFQSIQKINYIKIDVEGAELLVLEGGLEMIKKHRPVIIFELSGEWTRRFKYKPYQVICLLASLDYEMDEYDFQQWIARPKE